MDFSETQIKNIYNNFSQFSEIFEIWKLHITRERLFEHLRKDARHDIETLNPDILFDKYGGFVTSSFVIGGRIVINCCTDVFTFNQTRQMIRCLETMYRNLLRKPSEIERDKELDEFMARSDISVLTLGGDHQYGGRSVREHYDQWKLSLHDKPTFVDFSGNTGLIPIWELSENPQRRVLLQQAFADYAERIEDPIDLQPGLSTRREVQYEIITKTAAQQKEHDHVDVVVRVNGLWDRMHISLDDPDIENFKPDAEDRFCVAWRDLGEINSITLENLGMQSWDVDYVVIRNMDTNYTERFDCRCCLERDEGYPSRKTFYASMTQKQPVNA